MVTGVTVPGAVSALGAAAASAAFSRTLACPKCGGRVAMTENADGGDKGVAWSLGGKIFFWVLALLVAFIGVASWATGIALGLLLAAVYLVSLARHTAVYKCLTCAARSPFREAQAAASKSS